MKEPLGIRFLREHRLVIVDPSDDALVPACADVAGDVIVHPLLDRSDPALPRVIDMTRVSDEVFDLTVAHLDVALAAGDKTGIQAAISTGLSAQDLARHIGRQCVRPLLEGRLHIVRLWDPHVFMHLLWIWPPDVLADLMAPIIRWNLFLNGEPIGCPSAAGAGPGLRSRPEQHTAILDIGIVNRVLRDVPWAFDALPTLGPQIWRDVQRGRVQDGLHDDGDLALYAGQARRWGPGFTHDDDIRRALAMASDGETLYQDALMQIEPGAWANVQQRLDQQAKTFNG